jgi:outer membrane biosynthesis protein TonB
MREEDIDVLAVQRDDELLDALAARGAVPAFAANDPVAGLLAALAAEVDDDLGPATPFEGYALAGMAPMRRPRRIGRRTVLAVGVAGAVLSASGVAAAVSGDPFAPIRPIGKAIVDLKPAKVTPAQVDKELDGADAALGRGDHRTAREKLEKAKEKARKLSGPEGEAARQRLAQLEAELAAQTPTPSPNATVPETPVPTPGVTTPGADPTLTKEQLKEQKKKAKEEEQRKKKEEQRKKKDERQNMAPTARPTPAPEPTGPSSTSANLINPPPT